MDIARLRLAVASLLASAGQPSRSQVGSPSRSGSRSERFAKVGGEAGIRTLGTGLSPYNGLANRRFRPLSHLTGARDERRGYRTGGLETQAALRKLPYGLQGLQQLVAASLRTRKGIDTSRLSFFLSEPAAGTAPIASSAAFRTLADAGSDGISSR
jgi:hypothetical protein